MWYLPSGRRYPEDVRRPAISSTKIRLLLNKTSGGKQYDKIKNMALNPDKLMSILGLLKNSRDLTLGV
jgi:hypothetical protein